MPLRAAIAPEFREIYDRFGDRKRRQIRDKIEDILIKPSRNSTILKNPLIPVRSRHFGDFRIFYQWCEECRSRDVEEEVGCADCEDFEDDNVVFIFLEDRDTSYDYKRRMKIKRKKKKKGKK